MSYHHSQRHLGQISAGLQIGGKTLDELKADAKKAKKGFWDFFKEGLTPKNQAPPAPTAPPAARQGMPGWVIPAAVGGGALILFLVLKR